MYDAEKQEMMKCVLKEFNNHAKNQRPRLRPDFSAPRPVTGPGMTHPQDCITH